jgi:type 1 glutamine amidotransferase
MVLRDKLTPLGFTVDIVDADNNLFTDENLAKYRLVIMVQSSGQPVGMDNAEVDALAKFVRNGGALAGFHAATDTGYPDPHPYVALMGGKFIGHPGGIRTATCTPVAGANHPAVAKITGPFMHTDEIYTYSGLNPANQVILNCSSSINGDPPVPITWYRTEGAGRIFYTGLGHVDGLWTANSTFVNNHYWPGILWAIGR